MAQDEKGSYKLKLMIDTKSNKLIFAEAGKDCVDFLFSLLSLPAAKIVQLLLPSEETVLGSLQNLYRSLETMDVSWIEPHRMKADILDPMRGTPSSLLQLCGQMNFFQCTCSEPRVRFITTVCQCGKMEPQATYIIAKREIKMVNEFVTYIVTDDLVVTPLSSFSLLGSFGVKNINMLEEKIVTIGQNEAVKILGALMKSKTVLTDVFLREST